MTNPSSKTTGSSITCYSGGEGRIMNWSQNVRGVALAPVLRILERLRIRPGHVTLCSLVFGLGFCPLFLLGYSGAAFVFLFLHVLFDGVDGPLARHLGRDGDRGSFTDTVADQVVVAATILTMIGSNLAGAWAGGLYLFLYTVVVAFAMIRNALDTPYSWLLRPRFLIYVWFVVEVHFWPATLNAVLWITTCLLALKALTGFLAIRRRI